MNINEAEENINNLYVVDLAVIMRTVGYRQHVSKMKKNAAPSQDQSCFPSAGKAKFVPVATVTTGT